MRCLSEVWRFDFVIYTSSVRLFPSVLATLLVLEVKAPPPPVIFPSPFSGQSALLSTQIIYPNLHVTHPHRRSTTNPLFPFTSVLNVTLFRTMIPNHEGHLCVSCNGFYFSSFVTKGDRKPFTVIPSIGGCHFCRRLH